MEGLSYAAFSAMMKAFCPYCISSLLASGSPGPQDDVEDVAFFQL